MCYRALYLHIPFCERKCAYCDFDSRALGDGCAFGAAVAAYVDALGTLIGAHGRAGNLARVETVYIGGGTPSILGDHLPALVERVRAHCDPAEFSCEANPESFTSDLAHGLRRAGVTRISFGVQSLQSDELGAIGRLHSPERALEALALARHAGFSTSCDLMCGLPLQTPRSWDDTLERLIGADPDHVSVYPLQLEEGTPLARAEAAGEIEVPDEDVQAECMERAATRLGAAGYVRYEVASYARFGHRCEHNIAYWTGRPYLGLGRSAASMCDIESPDSIGMLPAQVASDLAQKGGTLGDMRGLRVRFTQLDEAGDAYRSEVLFAREAMAEDLMLACRMTGGIGADLLARARRAIPERELTRVCARVVERGLACWEGGALVPTHLGWLEGNELFGAFWGLSA